MLLIEALRREAWTVDRRDVAGLSKSIANINISAVVGARKRTRHRQFAELRVPDAPFEW